MQEDPDNQQFVYPNDSNFNTFNPAIAAMTNQMQKQLDKTLEMEYTKSDKVL